MTDRELFNKISDAFDENVSASGWMDGATPMADLIGKQDFLESLGLIIMQDRKDREMKDKVSEVMKDLMPYHTSEADQRCPNCGNIKAEGCCDEKLLKTIQAQRDYDELETDDGLDAGEAIDRATDYMDLRRDE